MTPNFTRTFLKVFVSALALSVMAGSAMAGGFSRGTADTDILFEDGNVNARMGATVVAPQRGYASVAGAAATDGNYINTYSMFSGAVKVDVVSNLSCAGTFSQPFGGSASYGTQAITAGIAAAAADGDTRPSGTAYTEFSTNEFGLTCGAKFDAGPGRVWILGGAFVQNISYEEGARIANATAGPLGVLSLDGNYVPGYRIGAAYDIPEIAFRAQGMYRSGIEHNLTGKFDVSSTEAIDNPAAVGSANFPQSFELKLQSGVAEGWLVFGSVKWTDWSVFDVLKYTTTAAKQKEFFYKDGWTYGLGVGHKFNDTVSGSVSFIYDTGVGTTEDVASDVYTLGAGLALTAANGGKLSLGGAVSYLKGGSVAQAANCNGGAGGGGDCGNGTGASFANTLGDDWAYTIGGNFAMKF
jgi:long-chain fatty acid transport protein